MALYIYLLLSTKILNIVIVTNPKDAGLLHWNSRGLINLRKCRDRRGVLEVIYNDSLIVCHYSQCDNHLHSDCDFPPRNRSDLKCGGDEKSLMDCPGMKSLKYH